MRVRILYHDHCFDGAASAAFFSRFFEGKYAPGAQFEFTGLAHKASQLFEDRLFDGDVNAIVDFKYSPSPKLDWWFDHHQSAFLSPQDADHFQHDRSGQKLFDPSFSSCTMFVAHVAREKFGFEAPDLAELVEWADVIDGARYENAQEAVELRAPAMKLTLVIESAQGSEIIHKIIRWMRHRKLSEIIEEPEIQQLYAPLHERHVRSIDIIRKRARAENGVIFFDLIDDELEGYNKFIPYLLHPESVYSVSVSASVVRAKVSLGTNPWNQATADKNLASLAEKFGGGGHARVSAISLEPGDLPRAREVARELVATLRKR